jgi:hypothetical protein
MFLYAFKKNKKATLRAVRDNAAQRNCRELSKWSAQREQSGCAECLTQTNGVGFDGGGWVWKGHQTRTICAANCERAGEPNKESAWVFISRNAVRGMKTQRKLS